MSEVNFDLFKCRCSSNHKLLAESRSNPCLTEKQAIRLAELEQKDKLTINMTVEMAELVIKKGNSTKVILSDSCIEYLMEWYAWEVAGKVAVSKESMYIQFIEKGKDVEGVSITLLSVVDGELYYKNDERVSNDYLTGEPDVFKGDNIMSATKITDVKSAWDYPGFLKKINQPVSKSNDLQIKGYMDITGAPDGEVAYCLVNTPERILHDLRGFLLKKMDVVSEESPEFLREYEALAASMFFDDIPHHKRVFKIKIEPFPEFQRQQLYDRVKICREWLWKFDDMYEYLNK